MIELIVAVTLWSQVKPAVLACGATVEWETPTIGSGAAEHVLLRGTAQQLDCAERKVRLAPKPTRVVRANP